VCSAGGEGQDAAFIDTLVANGAQHRGQIDLIDGDGNGFLVEQARAAVVGEIGRASCRARVLVLAGRPGEEAAGSVDAGAGWRADRDGGAVVCSYVGVCSAGGEGQGAAFIDTPVADGTEHRGLVDFVDGDGNEFLVIQARAAVVG